MTGSRSGRTSLSRSEPSPRPAGLPRVREATSAEWAGIGRITLDAYVAGGLIPADDPYGDRLRDVAGRAAQAAVLIAVDDDGSTLGSVTYCRPATALAEIARPGESEFRMLAVAPASRGRGVGEALVRACLDRAAAAGDVGLVLSTLDVTAPAQRLYLRLGFRREPDRDWQPVAGLWLRAYRRELLDLGDQGRL